MKLAAVAFALTACGRSDAPRTPPHDDAARITAPIDATVFTRTDAGRDPWTDRFHAWSMVHAGYEQTCAIDTEHQLWCWGNTAFIPRQGDVDVKRPPTRIDDAAWTTVSIGGTQVCGVRTDGSLWCWGHGAEGQLGTGTTKDHAKPVRVGRSTTWTDVVAGWMYTCALQQDGSLWCWGANDYGQLGLGDEKARLSPTRVGSAAWLQISTLVMNTCGIQRDHTLWCWANVYLGENTKSTRATRRRPIQIGTDTDWAHVSTVDVGACAQKLDGSLWCWGGNGDGQLGIQPVDSHDRRYAPERVGDRTWKSFSTGNGRACGIAPDGSLWCWGNNSYMQLASDTKWSHWRPERIDDATDWTSISVDSHLCGIRSDRSLWCWGTNYAGEVTTAARHAFDYRSMIRIDIPR